MYLFFGGSWLFSPCPSSPQAMFAITRDMDASCGGGMNHRFPAGKWTGADFNKFGPELAENGNKDPYVVTVNDYTPTLSLSQLFANTAANASLPFRYFPAGQYSVNYKSAPTVRVVQLPIPSRIVPATILQKAAIAGPTHFNGPASAGVATMQIFEYDGASSWHFNGNSGGAADHLHFHTVRLMETASEMHAPCMFKSLLTLLTGAPHDLTLSVDNCEVPVKGSGATQFSNDELQIPTKVPCPSATPSTGFTTMSLDFASCSGTGFGVA